MYYICSNLRRNYTFIIILPNISPLFFIFYKVLPKNLVCSWAKLQNSTKHLHLQPVLDDCLSLGCQYTLGMELDAMNVVVLVA